MVYESDFYTTRRPYRTTPSFSTYTVSSVPSRQVRVLPGLGKVHIVHSYDRIVPYVGHKRLTVVTSPPKIWSTAPSLLRKEYDWIENKLRPWVAYSPTSHYLNSPSSVRIYYRRYPISSVSSPLWHYDYYQPYRYYSSYLDLWPYYTRYSRYLSKYLPTSSYLFLDDYYRYLNRVRPYSWYYNSYRPSSYYLRSYLDYWPIYKPLSYYTTYSSYPSYYSYSSPDFDTIFGSYYNSLKSKRIVYSRYPIGTSTTCSCMLYPTYTSSYTNYYRLCRPVYLDSDYWPVFRTYRYYSPYWPLYRPHSFYNYPLRYRYLNYIDDYPAYRALKLQRIFDDETRSIRAQSHALLKRIHDPVPRTPRSWPITSVRYGYEDLSSYPVRWSNDNYIHKMMTVSPSNKVEYMTYYTEPVRKWFGQGHLASVFYAGDKAHSRRRDVWHYEDPVKNDIQLLSYYIAKFRQDKAEGHREPAKVPLPPNRASRRFTSSQKLLDDPEAREIAELREARAARLARIYAADDIPATPSANVEEAVKAKKKQEEQRLAEEKALAEEQARKAAQAKKEEEARKAEQAKKEEAARRAELARQEELAAQAAAERAAELERQAELARQEEQAKQAELERHRREEEERAQQEEERRREEEAKAEEERQALLRLEEIARQAEEEREADLARQAEELAELARQEVELAEQAKKQAEEEELARQEAELAELERQEAELVELEQKEKELSELAEQAKEEAVIAKKEAEQAELARQEEELAELERQQAELDALEAEAKALETDNAPEITDEDKVEEEEAAEEEAPADDNDGHVSADDAEQDATIEETLPEEQEEEVAEEEE